MNRPHAESADGYRGIWFTLGQIENEYGDKYSGGLGTYTAKHVPLAVHAPAVEKTFFVYGGCRRDDRRYLLDMVSYYDHKRDVVPRPVIVHDKGGVDDPHDNPSIAIDEYGHIWVFVSAVWLSEDAGMNWRKTRDVTANSPRNHSYARRPVQAHPDFYAFWADGNPDEPSDSRLYFSNRDGDIVRMLPAEMTEDFATPVRI